MSEFEQSVSNEQLNDREEAAKVHAMIAYGCMVLGLFTGAFWIIGAVWAMVKKDEARGTRFEDHYTNIITTFWWGLGLTIIGFILMVILGGYLVMIGVWIWSIYRVAKGLNNILSNRPFSPYTE